MKEIKFRAWDKKLKIMKKDTYELVDFVRLTLEIIQDWIWLQFTGLKDKNNCEIYEGDIVNFNGKKVIISWNEAEGLFWGGCNSQRFILQWVDMLEVIGNIYENPELMEIK